MIIEIIADWREDHLGEDWLNGEERSFFFDVEPGSDDVRVSDNRDFDPHFRMSRRELLMALSDASNRDHDL